ncbi:unnamed protein product, partial [Coccothraustes coccothraustes]
SAPAHPGLWGLPFPQRPTPGRVSVIPGSPQDGRRGGRPQPRGSGSRLPAPRRSSAAQRPRLLRTGRG